MTKLLWRFSPPSILILSLLLTAMTWPGKAMAASQLNLSWSYASSLESGFKIERKTTTSGTFTQITTVGANVTSYVDSNVTTGTTYCYRLRAYNATGDSPYSGEACGAAQDKNQEFTLTVGKTGNGMVSSSQTGIICGTTCSASYPSGTVVTLAATPATGSTFSGWSGGGCSGTGTCVIALNAGVSIMAAFVTATSPATPPPATPPSATPPPVTSGGLAAAYSFNAGSGSTITDSSGNNNTGTVSGTSWTTGKAGSALSFNGSSSAGTIPNSASLDIGGKALAIEFWVNIPNVSSGTDYTLLAKPWVAGAMQAPYYQYGVEFNANGTKTVDFFFGNTSGQLRGPFSVKPTLGSWTHIAFIYDGVNVKGYVNGVLQLQKAETSSIQARGNPLRVGIDGASRQPFRGLLDEVRIYSRTLSQAQIQTDMNTAIGGSSGAGPTVSITTPSTNPTYITSGSPLASTPLASTPLATSSGLAAVYNLDEGNGSTMTDSSGNNNTGILSGTSWTTGKAGSALSFNGSSSAGTIPNSASLDIGGKALAIEFWVNIPNVSSGTDYTLLAKPWVAGAMQAPYYQYGVEFNANGTKTVDFFFGNTSGQLRGPFSVKPTLGSWTHIAFIYDGVNVKGYVNGVLQLQKAETSSIQARGNPLRVGVDGASRQPFRGLLDEVRIYNFH